MSDLPGPSRGIIIKTSRGLIWRHSNNGHRAIFRLFSKWGDCRAYSGPWRRCIGFDQFLELYSSLSVGQRNFVSSIPCSSFSPLGAMWISLWKLVWGSERWQSSRRSRLHDLQVTMLSARAHSHCMLDFIKAVTISLCIKGRETFNNNSEIHVIPGC